MFPKKLFFAISLLSVFAIFCVSGSAQGTTTRVTGTVTDGSGAAVPGATVNLTNEGNKVVVATTTTNSSGVYLFDLVQPGNYKVSVEKEGFKRFESSNNAVLVNQPGTVNVKLEIGDVSAVVSVEGSAEQVQTSSSGNIGGTVEQRTIESLPIVGTRGRNPLDILNFQPGVVNGANTGGGVHVNGSRDRSFNFTLDGIDINESTAGGSNFTPLRPNPDSIQEFQIVTSSPTAELGRSSGAQVTFVTRSGTNNFRGSLFEYYQSKGMMARGYATNVNRADKENFIQHIFGGSFSGPLFDPGIGDGGKFRLLRDKAFFFVNLQMLRASDALLQTRTVYTPTARQGIFRWVRGGVNGPSSVDAAGNPIRPACGGAVTTNCIDSYNIATGTGLALDPFLMNYINQMPNPNSYSATGDGLNTAGFLFNSPQTEKQWDFVSKFDFKLNEQNSFYVRWAQGEQNTFGDSANGGRPRFPNAPNFVDTFRTPKNLALNWRTSPSTRFTNEFVLGYSKFGFNFLTPEPDDEYAFIFNLPTDINTNFSYNARSFRTWQFVDNMTFDFSPHVIKAGTNIRLGRSTDDRSGVAGGAVELAYNFSRTANPVTNMTFLNALPTGAAVINTADRTRLENMLNDVLGRVGIINRAFVNDPNNPGAFAPAGTRWLFDANHPELDFYVQDSWKARRNLTLDLGVRFEARFSPTAAGGRPILVPEQSVVLGSPASNTLKWREGDLFKDRILVLPSVGLAWDPVGDGKTSIRANYRQASDRFATFLFSSFIFQSTPGNNVLVEDSSFGASGGRRSQGLPNIAPPLTAEQLRTPKAFSTVATTVIDPDLKFPSIHNWTLSFQREIWGGNVVEVNYIGKKATNLFGGYNANQVNLNARHPSCGQSFLEAFNAIRGGSTSQCLVNLLFTGDGSDARGTTRFVNLNATALTQGSAATLALAMSQQVCNTTFEGAGLCTTAQRLAGARILDLRGFSSFFQPFSQFTGGMNVVDSNDFSFYNGLEFSFKRRMRNGISFNVGYTWALSKDTRSFDPAFTVVGTGATGTSANTPLNNFDRADNYAWSDFDRRHSLLGTYVVELPFGKGKKFRLDNSFFNYAISGWQVAGTFRITSGRPFSVFSGLNTLSQTSGSFASCNGCTRDMGTLIQGNFDNTTDPNLRNWWFSQTQREMFSQPDPGENGNVGRNFFVGPTYRETDISMLRSFRITETMSFDMRVDVRNLLNTPNFANPSIVLPAGLETSAPGVDPWRNSIFGRINADVTNSARRIQISGKFSF